MTTAMTPGNDPPLRVRNPKFVCLLDVDEDLRDLTLLWLSGAALTDPRIGRACAAKDHAALQRIAREYRIANDN